MEGDSRGHIEKLNTKASNVEHDDSAIFQSTWIRRNPVLVDRDDWKSVARQFRYVLYCGVILWSVHFLTMAIFS
jgi:hypothetical protein